MKVKYVHTNIIARDWKKLAKFYIDVFGCEPVYPERDHRGDWVDKLTKIKDVHIEGIHLRLPGYKEEPTLEIYQYNPESKGHKLPAINKPGLAHIAFMVDDVQYFFDKLLKKGGSKVGEIVKKEIKGIGILTVVYARDPEGNIIEIQSWK